jgi:hypothetical protein
MEKPSFFVKMNTLLTNEPSILMKKSCFWTPAFGGLRPVHISDITQNFITQNLIDKMISPATSRHCYHPSPHALTLWLPAQPSPALSAPPIFPQE